MKYIKDLKEHIEQEVTLKGWVANKRTGKGIAFIILRDGTGFVQCIAEEGVKGANFEDVSKLTLESAVEIKGNVVKDERQLGGIEIKVSEIKILSVADDYPIAKKEHGIDFLMDHRHLWLRSQRQWAIMRIRNRIIYAIHTFFQENGFVLMDAPIFTGNACEGTSTLFETDFYGEPAYISQSGQLYGEAMAMAHGRIYTFGPTFRAEKSKTRRHLSEFWMIEPEMAFYDLQMNMEVIEQFVRYVVKDAVNNCEKEFEMIGRDIEMLKKVDQAFPRLTYDEAIKVLKGEKDINGRNSIKTLEADLEEIKRQIADKQNEVNDKESQLKKGGLKKGEMNHFQNKVGTLKAEIKELNEKAENIPQWLESARTFEYGNDLGGSDETVITRLFDTPIMVYNWPKEVKAFYMKEDEQDPRFAKGVDMLAPEGFGEVVGGGQRETDIEILKAKIKEHELPMDAFEWYLDLRRYGSIPHSGFGLGLERLVAWICKLPHVRETIPFPRMYGRLFP